MTLRFGATTEQDLFNVTGKRNFAWKLLLVLRCNARALLEIRDELRRSNDQRDVFNASLLEFFERLTEEPSPGPSKQEQSARCTAMRGEQSWDRCVHEEGHEGARSSLLHVDEAGIAFSYPVGYAGQPEGPSGAGATAQVVEKEGDRP